MHNIRMQFEEHLQNDKKNIYNINNNSNNAINSTNNNNLTLS